MNRIDFAVGIGGENGQGIASTGNILALIFARRGLHLNAYNAYQSIIRGGHTFLTIRAGDRPVLNMGDKIDVFIPLNQDTMNRHLHLLKGGACAIFDQESITPGKAADGVQLCGMPMKELTKGNKLAVNTAALGAALQLLGIESEPLETVIARQFKKKGDAVVAQNVGMARMIETPVVCVDVQRAGPATGVPTKTEQGDLWQVLGAGQGDYPRVVVAPMNQLDLFQTIPELFNLCDRYQCPGLVLSDLLISEGTASIDPDDLDFQVKIDRGELILSNGNGLPAVALAKEGNGANPGSGYNDKAYLRYKNTPSGISPRAVPGVPGYIFTAATDEHDEDGTLISDEFTNPQKRRMMVEKRARKMQGAINDITPPKLVGPEQADVTLVGWGSTAGVIREAVEKLAGEEGIVANQLAIKWIVPLHAAEIGKILGRSKNVIVIENNQSGQFARYLRSETGFAAHGHIRKYDGEPFMPHHIVEAVKAQLAGQTRLSVPVHEVNA